MYNYLKIQLTYNKLQGLFLLSDINMGDYLIIKFFMGYNYSFMLYFKSRSINLSLRLRCGYIFAPHNTVVVITYSIMMLMKLADLSKSDCSKSIM